MQARKMCIAVVKSLPALGALDRQCDDISAVADRALDTARPRLPFSASLPVWMSAVRYGFMRWFTSF